MDTSTRTTLIALAVLILFVGGVWWWLSGSNTIESENNGMVDTTPPLNEEDTRPAGVPADWNETENSLVSFYHPSDFASDYVTTVDWPPQVNVDDNPYACVEAGEETERAGGTEEVTVGGNEYCRTVVAEGAAGSTYRQYAYAFSRDNETAILTFSVRFPQCANYEAEESEDCTADQEDFDPDALADQMVESMVWL